LQVDANELGVVSSDAQARPSFEATKLLSGSKAANAEEQFIAGTAPKHPSEIRIIVPKELPKDEKTGKPVEFNGEKEWHLLPYENLMEELHSRFDIAKNAGGLNSDEVERLQKIWGKNAITPPKTTPWWVKFLWNLISGFQLMLWAGAAMCFVVVGITANTPAGPDYQSLALAIVLILVVLITTTFQSIQEGKADQVMEALKKLAPSKVFCFRDGDLKEIDAVELVPGDIVKVNGGEKVPADIRILASSDLKVNNASLTGENIDIKLGSEANHKELYEAKNVARSGCNFTRGLMTLNFFTTFSLSVLIGFNHFYWYR
jgi:sodium/potassium-transporting ATPase subunit alpha